MKIELFIFDWSGVVSDDRRPVYEANMAILRKYDKQTMTFEKWLPTTKMTPVEFLNGHGINDDPKDLYTLYERCYNKAIEQGIVPTAYPDARDVFSHLYNQNKKLAVLSSHPAKNIEKEAEKYELKKFLSLILGESKNKVQGLMEICKALEKSPNSTLYLGDTVYDIKSAREAGVHSGAICCGYHIKERLAAENPEFLLNTLSDLINHGELI